MDAHFAWQMSHLWHIWHWAGSGGALGSHLAPWAAAVCVAGVALGDIAFHFAWQAWQLATWTCTCVAGVALDDMDVHFAVALVDMDVHFAWQAWHLVTWMCTLRGRCGACNAPGALRLFAWQAWHLWTSTSTLRGRRVTCRHGRALCVAGVALMALGCFVW